jgi:cAMP phosphodiesterase
MKVQLLPSNLSDPAHLQPLTTFLIDDFVAIDGGSLGFALDVQRQRQIRRVIVTHSHSDHIASLPVFIAEAFPFLAEPVYVYSTLEVIASLREHVFNDKIWPDFHQIPLLNGSGSGLVYFEIRHLVPFQIEHLRITPVWTNHTVPTVGLAIEDRDSAVVFTSDTHHTEEIWRLANSVPNLRAVFVDVSYPNEMETLAADSKHLTPQGLDEELNKLHVSVPVYAIHLKPQFRNEVVRQLQSLSRSNISIGEIGREYVFSSDARHRTSP